MRRWLSGGFLLGLAFYAALLTMHLAKFGTVEYRVPNVAVWTGRFPGFGYTWDLTAINLPARLVRKLPGLRRRVLPQAIRFPTESVDAPRAWSMDIWLFTGALGYTLAGLALGCIARAGAVLVRGATARPRPD